MVKHDIFNISTVRAHIDIFSFLLLKLMLADLPPPVEACSGQEWHFYISTVRAHTSHFYISTVKAHVGRSTPSSRGM